MAKAKLKTTENERSVEEYLNGIADENAKEDCREIAAMMERATGAKAKMWGGAIVGFGKTNLKYETGREVEVPEIAFAARKQNLTLYLDSSEGGEYEDLTAKLGKHKTSKACLYFKKLGDVDEKILEKLIEKSVEITRRGR